VENKQKPLTFLTEEDEVEGEDAQNIQINYATSGSPVVEFTYDETNESYLRYNDSEQTVELSDETPIEVENVFIAEMDHEVIDKEGRRAIDLESGGNGYLIQKGKGQTVEWENSDGRIVPTKDGEEIGLVKGQTWINIIPIDKLRGEQLDQLFDAMLLIKTREEFYRFFDDLATMNEVQSLAQRLQVARMLDKGDTYSQIEKETNASTATISRVRRCLDYGSDGYEIALERLKEK